MSRCCEQRNHTSYNLPRPTTTRHPRCTRDKGTGSPCSQKTGPLGEASADGPESHCFQEDAACHHRHPVPVGTSRLVWYIGVCTHTSAQPSPGWLLGC